MMAHKPTNTQTSADTFDLPNTIHCVQSNLRRSHQAQLNLFLDIVNKNVYKDGIDVIFITEPYTVRVCQFLLKCEIKKPVVFFCEHFTHVNKIYLNL